MIIIKSTHHINKQNFKRTVQKKSRTTFIEDSELWRQGGMASEKQGKKET